MIRSLIALLSIATLVLAGGACPAEPSGDGAARGGERQAHRLLFQVGQRAPEPLHRPEAETPQPDRAEHELEGPDRQHDGQQINSLRAAVEAEPVSLEDRGAEEGL